MISDFNMGKNFNNGAYPNMDGPRILLWAMIKTFLARRTVAPFVLTGLVTRIADIKK